jgi:GxxExxY protein
MNSVLYSSANEFSHRVIGAAIEVHKELGPGFLEAVYEEALIYEFDQRGIPYTRQHIIQVSYKGRIVGAGRLDLFVGNCLVIELKAVEALASIHDAQLGAYLKALKLPLGLLLNFNVTLMKTGIKRIIKSEF